MLKPELTRYIKSFSLKHVEKYIVEEIITLTYLLTSIIK